MQRYTASWLAAGITVMTFMLNNATSKAAPATQPPAIIINVPSAAPPASR